MSVYFRNGRGIDEEFCAGEEDGDAEAKNICNITIEPFFAFF